MYDIIVMVLTDLTMPTIHNSGSHPRYAPGCIHMMHYSFVQHSPKNFLRVPVYTQMSFVAISICNKPSSEITANRFTARDNLEPAFILFVSQILRRFFHQIPPLLVYAEMRKPEKPRHSLGSDLVPKTLLSSANTNQEQ